MRSPWIRRDVFDGMVAQYERLLAAAHAGTVAADDRYNSLLEKYHALRQTGHVIPEPKAPPQPVVDEFPTPVETAIVVAAEGNKGLERHLRSRARVRLARNEDPSDVARVIQNGDGSDE